MSVEFTARGSGYYRVYVDGIQVSRHIAEREAAERAVNEAEANPGAHVRYDHDYEVDVILQSAPSRGGGSSPPSGGSPTYDEGSRESSYSSNAITLPWTECFENGDTWSSVFAASECGGSASHNSSAGWGGGGCVEITPPTSACTGGGINGGNVGFGGAQSSGGAPEFTGVNEFHLRFLVKIGSTYLSTATNGGGSMINKFVDVGHSGGSRAGILGLQVKYSSAPYWLAFGIQDDTEGYVFAEGRGWVEDAALKIDSGSGGDYIDEYICVEYVLDVTNDTSSLYLWTQDGVHSGHVVTVTKTNSSTINKFYWSYYNLYCTASANNHIFLDNIKAATSYIGPPTGFVTG